MEAGRPPYERLFTDRDGQGRAIPSQELIRKCVDGLASPFVQMMVDAAIDTSGAATRNLTKVLLKKETTPDRIG